MASSPFPKSSSTPGEGHITATVLPNGTPGLSSLAYQYPLKLISPSRNPSPKSALVFLLSYGGGLVAGDAIALTITLLPDARLTLTTQGHTKIFAPPPPPSPPTPTTRQRLAATVAPGAALCLLPDPVQPFAGSAYAQTQTFRLRGRTASLCLLDWVTRGRGARGEDWSLARWAGRNEVWAVSTAAGGGAEAGAERLLLRDAVLLDGEGAAARGVGSLRAAMHGLGVSGTLVLRGPLVEGLGRFFLEEFAALPRLGARDFRSEAAREREDGEEASPLEAWRASRLRREREENVLWSAANVRGCVVVKFAAATVESGRVWVGDMLIREGSVAENFGEQALICVR